MHVVILLFIKECEHVYLPHAPKQTQQIWLRSQFRLFVGGLSLPITQSMALGKLSAMGRPTQLAIFRRLVNE